MQVSGYGTSRDDVSTMRAWLPMPPAGPWRRPGKDPPDVTGRELVEWAACRWRVVPTQRSLKTKKRSLLAHPRVYLQFSKVPPYMQFVLVLMKGQMKLGCYHALCCSLTTC